MTWKQSKPIWIVLGLIATPVVIAIFFLAQLPSGGPLPAEDEPVDATIEDFQFASKMKLEEVLRDPESARYDGVRTHLISDPGEATNYAFCGRVNAKNGFGGYAGWQRFFANPLIAAVEDGSTDFDKLWQVYCSGDDQGEIWF